VAGERVAGERVSGERGFEPLTSVPLAVLRVHGRTVARLTRPPYVADERTSLLAFLEVQRAVIRWKVEGIDGNAQGGVATPSGMTLLGIVRHLTDVERWWFRDRWAGEDVQSYYNRSNDGADFRVPSDETVEHILHEYAAACAESNALVATAESLDVPGKRHQATLRWVDRKSVV
jgi:hypothetical protein